MKKLIPAIVMLLVSAVILSTASYAWFTISADVEASGMQVTASAPSSVLISGKDPDNQTASWSTYTSFVNFSDMVSDTYVNKLQPVSSWDGETFYNIAQCEDITGAAVYGTDITEVDDLKGFVASYQLKLQNTSTENAVNIVVSEIKIADSFATSAISGAIRVAIKNENDGTTYVYNPSGSTGYVNVLAADGSVAQAAVGPINAEYTGGVAGAFADTAKGVAPAYKDATQVIANITAYDPTETTAAGTNGCFTYEELFTVYIWIEGQSSACITANAGLSSAIEIVFAIDN